MGKRALLPVSNFNAERCLPNDRPGMLFEVGTHGRMPRLVAGASGRAGRCCSPRGSGHRLCTAYQLVLDAE